MNPFVARASKVSVKAVERDEERDKDRGNLRRQLDDLEEKSRSEGLTTWEEGHLKELREKLKTTKAAADKTYSMDQIYTGCRKLCKDAAESQKKIRTDEEYQKWLGSTFPGKFEDVADEYVVPGDPKRTADKLHYYQAKPEVAAFLKKYVIGK